MNVEILETKDYGLLAKMNEEVQTFHHQTYPDIFKPYNKEAIANFFKTSLEQDNAKAFIAKEKEVVFGYALAFIIDFAENPFQYSRKYILLDQLLVSENYRAKGIGRLLLDAIFSFAQSNKINTIELNHWTHNSSARSFFKKCGFQYYNEKMWTMI